VAIAFDQQLAKNETAVGGTTQTLTTGNAVASGGFITLLVGWFGAGSLSSVTGGSLTWSIDKTIANGSVHIALVSAQAAAGLASATVLTANYSASVTSRAVAGCSFTGIVSSAALDATASATPAAGTAWNCGGVITTNANDVVVGVVMGDAGAGTTSTPAGGWTEVPATAGDFNDNAAGDSWTMVYQIVSATGTYTPSGTWGISETTAGASGAYMAAGGGGGTVVKQLAALGVG
jgi:hypothetical protein